uniref:NACHT and WD repeat domain-containing protein 1 n=1 Tax=Lygus hesperus TaxID=30085 RepID=A0A146LA42_LYGHE
MGSNCSSSHKDDDSSSRKSQESPSYQLSNKDGDGKKMDEGVEEPKSSVKAGVVLSVSSVPEPALPPQPMLSVSDSIMTASPAHKPKEPEVVQPIRPSILDLPPVKDAKIVIYICAADSQDCRVEKSLVHNEVFPGLREKCRSKGFELHIVDLHWSIQDRTAEPAELCLQELARQNENSYLIPLVFLNHFLGTPLLPKTLENADFQTVTSEERSGLLLKWYRLDSTAQPPCYTLQPPVTHIPDLKSADKDVRDRALQQWRKEVESILTVMLAAFSQELRDTYLSTVVEQEVQHTVLMSQELAKRCLWISRGGKVPDPPTAPGDQELRRRLEALQKTLKGELSESHMIHVVPAATPDHSEQPDYIQQVTSAVSKQLDSIVDAIFEEHENKLDQLRMASDLDMRVITEVTAHARAALRYSQSSVNRQCDLEKALNDSGDGAVVLYGPQGSGKTTLLCKLGNQLEAEAEVILRLVGLTAASSTLVQVLRSVTDQLCPATVPRPHNLKAYTAIFNDCLAEASKRGKTVIIIDGIDQFRDFGENCVSWVPPSLPPNVKLVFGCSDGQILENLKTHLNGTNAKFIPILDLSKKEMETILLHNILEYNHSVNPIVKDCISNSVDSPPLPLYVKVVAWQSTWCNEYNLNLELKSDVKQQVNTMLDQLESIFGKEQVEKVFSLMCSSKWGLQDSELLDLLISDSLYHTSTTYLPWAGACLFLSKLTRHLGPFLLSGDHRTLKLRDSAVIEVSRQRYDRRTVWATKTLKDYFLGNLWKNNKMEVKARMAGQPDKWGDMYNVRKFEELPYLVLRSEGTALNLTLDHEWILNKLCATDAYQVIEDAYMENTTDDITWLMNFLSDNAESLTYDGRQLYTQVHRYAKNHNPTTLSNVWKRIAMEPPMNTLLEADVHEEEKPDTNQEGFNIVQRLPKTNSFVVSVRTNLGEISIWDIAKCQRVRHLTGLTQPAAIEMVDNYKCVVLCNRELHTYDLDKGVILTKLKGVMNQKMPFFGLHDSNHLVALSRNRMYVNLMNLDTGDCVTTFKAGEDRFLNSLLVSADGKTLVCGDETQKPFPLLVWNLASRKLLYDLRIPQHEFLSRLSAITPQGNYVCCVAKEVVDNTPNYIVVYDLQSGTLFKKWKPAVNTTSIDISHTESCLVSGHASSKILSWSLGTGNCRYSLSGHTAPVDFLRLSPNGKMCLSMNREGRDRSIRIWDIAKGSLIAVFTPDSPVMSCELTDTWVVISVMGNPNLVCLEIRGPDFPSKRVNEIYGTPDAS